MIRLAVIAIAVLMLATPAVAGVPSHPDAHFQIKLGTRVASAPVTLRSKVQLASTAHINSMSLSFNGHRPQTIWYDTPYQAEFGWHGAIATLSVSKKRGPVVVRIANSRPRPVAVRVVVDWSP